MNAVLNTTIAAFRSISGRSRNDFIDASTLVTICLTTAALAEALKDQVADLQEQLENAKTDGPKLLPAPKISLGEYNALLTQIVSEASKIRRFFD